MRILALVPLLLLVSGCLAPGERDPTRYPWDRRNAPPPPPPPPHPRIEARGAIPPWTSQPPASPPSGTDYCVISLDPGSKETPPMMACSAPLPPSPPPAPPPAPPHE